MKTIENLLNEVMYNLFKIEEELDLEVRVNGTETRRYKNLNRKSNALCNAAMALAEIE